MAETQIETHQRVRRGGIDDVNAGDDKVNADEELGGRRRRKKRKEKKYSNSIAAEHTVVIVAPFGNYLDYSSCEPTMPMFGYGQSRLDPVIPMFDTYPYSRGFDPTYRVSRLLKHLSFASESLGLYR
ncbi:hypothetical protein Scep_014060 [Stephania cephalantha]|uniref:Uncharacterized protein n=1 Tax=Stephania cephalantha TaxID=152367 RepID=A0AAP0P087_9MAGN